MRKTKAFGAMLLVLGVTLFPAAGAIFQLGASLAAIDRMHRFSVERPPAAGRTEMIGRYVGAPASTEGALQLRPMTVLR